MGFDDIYDRVVAREADIWIPFSFNGPFPDGHEEERSLIFGLYSGSYLHGLDYLEEIQVEDLARLVDVYDSNMAQLTGEEANLVLEVAAKRYIQQVEGILHDSKMNIKQHGIDVLNSEYDAKIEALSSDEKAIETKRYEIEIKRQEIAARIIELEAAISTEEVEQEMVDLDISKKQLEKSRVDLSIVDAGIRGLDIQLAIAQAGIEMVNTDVDIVNAENAESEVDLKISEVDIEEAELELKKGEIELGTVEEEGYRRTKINNDIKQVKVRIAETETAIAELDAEEAELSVQVKKIQADESKLALANSDLSLIQSRRRVKIAENGLLKKRKDVLEAEKDNIIAETALLERQQEARESMDAKQVALIEGQTAVYLDAIEWDMEFREAVNALEIMRYGAQRDLADNSAESNIRRATKGTESDDASVDAAEIRATAVIASAGIIANSSIQNNLTHVLG